MDKYKEKFMAKAEHTDTNKRNIEKQVKKLLQYYDTHQHSWLKSWEKDVNELVRTDPCYCSRLFEWMFSFRTLRFLGACSRLFLYFSLFVFLYFLYFDVLCKPPAEKAGGEREGRCACIQILQTDA